MIIVLTVYVAAIGGCVWSVLGGGGGLTVSIGFGRGGRASRFCRAVCLRALFTSCALGGGFLLFAGWGRILASVFGFFDGPFQVGWNGRVDGGHQLGVVGEACVFFLEKCASRCVEG